MSVVKFYNPPPFEAAVAQSVDPYSNDNEKPSEASWLLAPFMKQEKL